MGQGVIIEKCDGVATVILSNPPMNLLNETVLNGLIQAFTDFERDESVRVIVITGAGDRAFAAGADIKEFPGALSHPDRAKEIAGHLHGAMNAVDRAKQPTIAVLFGHVLGGGLELALACDLRICEEGTHFGLPESNLGIMPGAGGTQRLPRLVGASKALEIALLGEPIDAEAAEKIGLVNRVVPQGEAKAVAAAWAKRLSQRSQPSLSAIKTAVKQGLETNLTDGLELEVELFVQAFQREDSREGITAFLEKRQAVFKHR